MKLDCINNNNKRPTKPAGIAGRDCGCSCRCGLLREGGIPPWASSLLSLLLLLLFSLCVQSTSTLFGHLWSLLKRQEGQEVLYPLYQSNAGSSAVLFTSGRSSDPEEKSPIQE